MFYLSLNSRMGLRHLLSISDLGSKEIQRLFDASGYFAELTPEKTPLLLKGRTVVNLFFENSTRTRMSFETATRRLGGTIANFTASQSSVQKGETLVDTVRNIAALQASAWVIRHGCAGSPRILAEKTNLPVINAGDGFHEHPTQALLDAYTILRRLGSVRGKKIVIVGDIAHSRVARSNILLLRKLGAEITVCGPPTLLPPNPEALGVRQSFRLDPLLADADVVMCLRIQLERQNKMQIPSLAEYSRFWGLSSERAARMKKSAIVLHPGPINRGVELDSSVADGPRSAILDQVSNGAWIRMAVLARAVVPESFDRLALGKRRSA